MAQPCDKEEWPNMLSAIEHLNYHLILTGEKDVVLLVQTGHPVVYLRQKQLPVLPGYLEWHMISPDKNDQLQNEHHNMQVVRQEYAQEMANHLHTKCKHNTA